MNLAIAYPQQQEVPVMKVVRNDKRVFQTRFLRDLNLVTVRGWSMSTETNEKYDQLQANIENHLTSSNSLNVHFKYELFDSATLRYLFAIIKTMNEAHAKGKIVKIYWSYELGESNEMIEMGNDLAGLCDFSFKICNI